MNTVTSTVRSAGSEEIPLLQDPPPVPVPPAPSQVERDRRQNLIHWIGMRARAQMNNISRMKSIRPSFYDLQAGRTPDGVVPLDWESIAWMVEKRDELRGLDLAGQQLIDFEGASCEVDYVLQEAEPFRPMTARAAKAKFKVSTSNRRPKAR